MFDLARRSAAEAGGTLALVAAVVGSGIMAQRLTNDVALALLCNTIATGAALIVLISILAPISGAHFNPIVTLALAWTDRTPRRDVLCYLPAQIGGGLAGAMLAHAMFGLPLVQIATTIRSGSPQMLSETVATFGLTVTIFAGRRFAAERIAAMIGLYITAAYWFTASTSFANPAVAIARAITATFSGIRPLDVPGFIAAEAIGGVLAVAAMTWLLRPAVVTARPQPSANPLAAQALDTP
jgi:glycerol uptake facilitator-like aquaporin